MNMPLRHAETLPLIVLELNELCPPILDEMMQKNELPNFKALYGCSDVHVTHTDDPDLEPWVQWVTFHTGKTQSIHGAKELDEGYRITLPRLWDKLSDKGIESLVFGSMNAAAQSEQVTLIPDPWSVRVKPSQSRFSAFHEFIRFHVTEHTSKVAKPDRKLTLDFLGFILTNGLRLSTIARAVGQIISEKTSRVDVKWRRALILDHIMWDVFAHSFRKKRPQFATFFANSTAFLQHRYWRHMNPEVYKVKPSEGEMRAYGNAIHDSYRHMDGMIGRARKLLGRKGRLAFVTALSQEANLRYENIGGKFVYRPFDFHKLNRWLGGPEKVTFEPVMTHQAWASFETACDAAAFVDQLKAVTVLDRAPHEGPDYGPVFYFRQDRERVFFDCHFKLKQPETMVIRNQAGESVAFSQLFDCLGQVNNSQHNRDGAFWVERADKASRIYDEKLPLQAAHEKILELYVA